MLRLGELTVKPQLLTSGFCVALRALDLTTRKGRATAPQTVA